jgi:energy-coupling factor transporter ATP-binding protein EcfA2
LIVNNLREIRGIGPSVEEKLKTAFGSENAVLTALRESRIAEISSVEGIGERFALNLCRNLHFQETGEQIQNFLKTEDAILIYNRTIDLISKFANTMYSRSKLYLFFPLPFSAIEKIRQRQHTSRLGHRFTSLIKKSPHSFKDYNLLFRNLSPLKDQINQLDTASRVIATADKEIYGELSSTEIGNHCEILYIEDLNQISGILGGYDEVIWIGSDIMLDEGFPNVLVLSESQRTNLLQIIPEKTLSFFAHNKRILESISELAELLQTFPSSELEALVGDLNLDMLVKMGNELINLNESGEPNQNLNEEYSRLFRAESIFETKLAEILLALNEELENKLQDTTVELGGEKILALLKGLATEDHSYSRDGGKTELREYLDEELYLAVEEIIIKAEDRLINELNLQSDETDYISGIFPRELRYPVDPVEEVSERLKVYLRQRRAIKSFELKVGLAKSLEQFESLAKNALTCMLELDYLFMIGKFTRKYLLTIPQLVVDQSTGLIVEESRNLFLLREQHRGNIKVDPVSYAIGEIGKIDGIVNGERIVLLSGANSGGKTTLIISIAIIVILAQMGLPIPCKSAVLSGFEELHYYRKSSGQMDAGAFESTLRVLSQMILSPNSRLVLADEMESISEPGASARVIAAFLDLLGKSPQSVGLFVTHLAQLIAKYAKEKIRIDGIEAQGLSENLELIVNRTPVYYKYAKSTPELIVRRLQKISQGTEKEIYTYILDAFENN